MKTKNVELRQATRLKIGQRLAEAAPRRINLHDVAIALGVSERTLRNWRTQAKKGVPKTGRPSQSIEVLSRSRELVFEEMKKSCVPGWRPIAEKLQGKVTVRNVQKFVAEYKAEIRRKVGSSRMQVNGKNVIWSIDGAITKEESKVENQVIKDRGSRYWLRIKSSPRASSSKDVVEILEENFKEHGVPLVVSTDNGSALSNNDVSAILKKHKVIHLKSLPRTPQHNGAVEAGIKELREIMAYGQINLKGAIKVANSRLKIYGKKWSTPTIMFENSDMLYTKPEHDEFYFDCNKRILDLQAEPLSFRKMRLKEREIVFEELEKRGFITKWKMTKYG